MSKRFFLATIAGAALLASPAHAALIAGWDFSQYVGDGWLSVDAVTETKTLTANNSAFDPSGGGIESAPFGTMYADGQFTSTNVIPNTQLAPTAGSLNSNLGNAAPPGNFFDQDFSYEGGQIVTSFVSLTAFSPVSLVFKADLTSVPEFGQNWSIAFGGQTFEDASSVNVLFSLDGQSYSAVGSAQLNTNDLPFSFVLPGAAADQIFVKLELTGAAGAGQAKIDNFGIYGDIVVPEPGTVVLLLSGLAGLAAVGRRRD